MATALGDILRVACQLKWNGVDDHVNVIHVRVGVLPGPNTTAALLEDLSEWIADAYGAMTAVFTTTVTTNIISVYNVTQDLPVGLTAWGGGFTGGSASGDGMPPDDGLVVLLDTGLKRRQGKMYFSGLAEARHNGGFWDGTARTAAATLVSNLLVTASVPNNGDYQLQVYSRTDGEAYDITVVRAQEQVADVPSRKAGRGS